MSLRSRPELHDKPVVVAHSSKDVSAGGLQLHVQCWQGMGQIASCNYRARAFGIRNGWRAVACNAVHAVQAA